MQKIVTVFVREALEGMAARLAAERMRSGNQPPGWAHSGRTGTKPGPLRSSGRLLAVAHGLVRRPRLLMLDEPSAGLSPVLVDRVFVVVRRLRETGPPFCWSSN